MKKQCQYCKFAVHKPVEGCGLRRCYRFPGIPDPRSHKAHHPIVKEDDWCREFQEKDSYGDIPVPMKMIVDCVRSETRPAPSDIDIEDFVGILPDGRGVKITAVGRCCDIGDEPGLRKVEMIDLENLDQIQKEETDLLRS